MKVEKRDGRIVQWDSSKIEIAIRHAFESHKADSQPAQELTNEVVHIIKSRQEDIVHIEEIQDVVEEVLMVNGYTETAKRYIKYREKRAVARRLLRSVGVVDDLKLGPNAATIAKRYLLKDADGNPIETPSQLFRRVAKAIAKAEKLYDQSFDYKTYEELFYDMIANLEFMPNSPTLYNAGTEIGQLSACFVLPIRDDMDSIFTTLWHMARVQKSGGGTGFSFSQLRPKGAKLESTGGIASGPVSFMRVYDTATDVIKQGGRRRGANMALLRCNHPDIMEFISAKSDKKSFSNFNISVAITCQFMDALKNNGDIDLVNPNSGEVEQTINARMIFDSIIINAWNTGDPGLIFIDRINDKHPLKGMQIESTNPCGEMPLLPYESCVLGSLNLAQVVKGGEVNWKRLSEVIPLAIRFLDNIIDLNKYPVEEIEIQTKATRKIGLGIMGWAEMLIQLGIPYDSQDALELAEKVMEFIRNRAERATSELAKIRGNFEQVDLLKHRRKWKRNATLITIAPTGSISLIAGTSSGIEPLFAIVHDRILAEGVRLTETNKYFVELAEERGFWNEEVEQQVASSGSVQDIKGIPDDVKRLFKTAHEIEPEWHVRMQAAFQKHADNAVSKTVNVPNDSSTDDIRRIFLLADELALKGITVFRDGCLEGVQVLYAGCPTCEDVRFTESP
ncbi:MAG: adenosylcobalamin-dependent ribonucleoside-diphosphate reductase [Candidatus Thorarchaeota archaeon]